MKSLVLQTQKYWLDGLKRELPKTILLSGEKGSGKHIIVDELAKHYNLEVLDITDNQQKHHEIQDRVENAKKMSEQYDTQSTESAQQLSELKQQQVRLTKIKDDLQAKLLIQTQSISELENNQNINAERANNRQANLEQIQNTRNE